MLCLISAMRNPKIATMSLSPFFDIFKVQEIASEQGVSAPSEAQLPNTHRMRREKTWFATLSLNGGVLQRAPGQQLSLCSSRARAIALEWDT